MPTKAMLMQCRVHELAAAVGFSSQLDDREMLSQDLFEVSCAGFLSGP
jgi:hypothetical protein